MPNTCDSTPLLIFNKLKLKEKPNNISINDLLNDINEDVYNYLT
jgi:hypothetical protein